MFVHELLCCFGNMLYITALRVTATPGVVILCYLHKPKAQCLYNRTLIPVIKVVNCVRVYTQR
jgi:hypothetical protein